MASLRRIIDHPSTRVALLMLAGAQAMIGAFVVGLAVNIGLSGVREQPGKPVIVSEPPMPPGPFPLTSTRMPGIESTPGSIALAPDGAVWFTRSDNGGPVVGRVDRAGTVRLLPIPSRFAPRALAAGADGTIWLAGGDQEGIGRLSPAGALTWHPIGWRGVPAGITAGPDGNLWFTLRPYAEGDGNWIGRMTPAGTVTRFPLPAGRREPGPIIAGPDGNLWFATADALGRITPGGDVTMVDMTTTLGGPTLTAGPDGAVWFAANALSGAATVGRVETGRTPRITDIHELPNGASVRGIAAGADGNLWVAENGLQSIARVTPRGQVTQYTLDPDRFPELMAAGKDGPVWFTVLSGRRGAGLDRFDIPR